MSNEITNIDKQIEIMEKKKSALKSHVDKNRTRKERTRRLIQVGALAEKYFELQSNDMLEVEDIFSQFSTYVKAKKLDKHKKE